jgi:YHS domain-containing protein
MSIYINGKRFFYSSKDCLIKLVSKEEKTINLKGK